MPDILPSFLQSATQSIASLGRLNRIASLITGLVIPTLVGLFATYYQDLVKINPLLFWGSIAVFIGWGAAFAFYTYDVRLPAEALTDEYIYAKIDSVADIKVAIGVVMKTIVDNREPLFNFRVNELWNFAVYLYDSDTDLLIPVWRDRHPNHPSPPGEGRRWKPGVGHIGMAFSQGEARITPNARIPETAELLKLPSGQARDYDEHTYVSFISQPILRTHPDESCGVVVATSNVPGRFDEVTGLALNHAASELGALLSLAYVGPVPI